VRNKRHHNLQDAPAGRFATELLWLDISGGSISECGRAAGWLLGRLQKGRRAKHFHETHVCVPVHYGQTESVDVDFGKQVFQVVVPVSRCQLCSPHAPVTSDAARAGVGVCLFRAVMPFSKLFQRLNETDEGAMRVVFLAAAGIGAAVALQKVVRQIDSLVVPRRRFRVRHGNGPAGVNFTSKTTYTVLGTSAPPTLADIPTLVTEMRDAFESGVTLPLANRLETLVAMKKMFVENEQRILRAVWEDLRRPEGETLYYDFLLVKTEIQKLITNLHKWTKPERVSKFSLLTFPSSQWVEKDAFGTVLIIGPFNYPFALTAGVVAGAVAGGNNVVLKPSNDVPFSSNLLRELFVKYVDPRVVTVVGPHIAGDGVDVVTSLMRQKLDFVFFTGSSRVGAIIAKQAAETLTPIALELGGKNPVFVDETADLSLAAKQCVWGRTLNCGQQCVAPEFVLVHRSVLEKFLEQARRWTHELVPDPYLEGAMGRLVGWNASASSAGDDDKNNAADDSDGNTSGRKSAAMRVKQLLDVARAGKHGEKIVVGGGADFSRGVVEPTVVVCGWDSPLMREEMFAPVLCVVPYDDLEDATRMVRTRPKPLALYVFSKHKKNTRHILDNTTSGGVTINGVLFHVGHTGLPFGGVGESGAGSYHGEASVKCFTHQKPTLRKWRDLHDFGVLTDPFFVYGPHDRVKRTLLRAVAERS
jgi:aldehyde dehydrogenase (NAD+)